MGSNPTRPERKRGVNVTASNVTKRKDLYSCQTVVGSSNTKLHFVPLLQTVQLICIIIIFQLGGTGRRVKVVSSSQTRPLTSALMSSARNAKSARRKSAKSASGRRKIILPKQRTKRNQGGRKTTRTRTRRSESFPKPWSAALRMIPTKAYLEMALIFIFKSVVS